mgnify:CR=1 FL=1
MVSHRFRSLMLAAVLLALAWTLSASHGQTSGADPEPDPLAGEVVSDPTSIFEAYQEQAQRIVDDTRLGPSPTIDRPWPCRPGDALPSRNERSSSRCSRD